MAIILEQPKSRDDLTEFASFPDRVYAKRAAHWPSLVPHQLGLLAGESAAAIDRDVLPLLAREDGEIVARVAAVVDHAYIRHWNEPLGHLVFFEALPGSETAVRELLHEGCAWLETNSLEAARLGFLGAFDMPLTIDAYEALPPFMLRQNPAYYHALVKQAAFETERGWVDYKIHVTPQLVERWKSALESTRRGGFDVVPLRDVPEERRVREYTALWNHAFQQHWGQVPFTEAEVAELFQAFEGLGALDTSVLAYRGDEPVGVLMVIPSTADFARLESGRRLDESERLNVLGIGVHESARGRGVNYGMAAYAYLELVRRGATWLSYTLVLDDNWPSRRTGEGLGGRLCANYLTYRRELRR
jgi:GNAT superfamily N-acetyltransferase